MSIIARSVKIAHILGVLMFSSICIYKLLAKGEPVQQGALTIVKDSNENYNDEDDGVVTDEEPQEYVDDNIEQFEPTDEWKTVKKGQKIPPGLHVRMDFKTGLKEAKLMSDSKSNVEQWDAGENIGIINTEKKRFTRDELKAALKDFKYKDETSTQEKENEIKKKFRSYDELKKDLQDMQMTMKTEGEIVTGLVKKLKAPGVDHVQLKVLLVDLEYYLHQIDNAKIFSDLGGLHILLNLINSSNTDIQESALHTLGAALQSNAKVQVATMDIGIMQHLLRTLSVDPNDRVRKKALYAVSTLIRQFPFAQKKFLKLGGLSALANLFTSAKEENIKIKIITLLTDLLLEYDWNLKQGTSTDPVQQQRLNQYKEVHLRESMSTSGWCSLMTSLLHSPTGHDSVEKIVNAMSTLVGTCKAEFVPARTKLQALLGEYQKLAEDEIQEGSEDLYHSIYSNIKSLVQEIYREDL
ncbi:nucleotide exchange factor SIL1-like [Physella acuta]|uniref:nucleotide exchange factor SIL1-like n=1 Tax=Physella acuta TaxID=109671 RepID=UPI0027DE56BE|nr:nucleotide exchange factor SIL1-like [Physella acuta]XP_059151355.1 nucleotide exchange factor SIL1-like [Physella acuta]XP_059151356.1 nucleotide exchange factor SIL1-like [Physella acuta]XP_059151357.1 nucleotide exchange factor SIL1-like [Physella acuta]